MTDTAPPETTSGDADQVRVPDPASAPDPVRARAVRRLKKKRDLATHVLVYVLVNVVLVIIWAITSNGGFFWPVFPIAFWGIGVVMNAWDVFHSGDFSDAEIDREVARMQGQKPAKMSKS